MKRALCVFSLVIVGVLAFAATPTVRFYLTELDFISSQPVPESETQFRSHIKATFDEENNIIKKTYIDPNGKINQSEIFTYDSTHTLIYKDIYLSGTQLIKQLLFGMEEKAVDYVEYVYGVDTVKDWTDRFSILDYNQLSQLVNHAFFDVNAFQYGFTHFEYDSLGYLSKEEWVREPSGKTMRLWNHFFDPATQLTRIMQYDSNGVLVQDFQLSPDGTESIFWFKNLTDSLFINHTLISFSNESYLDWGKVIWIRVDTTDACCDSIEYLLPKQFLVKGHFTVNTGLDSFLVDSATYDIVFTGKGSSGYDATERRVNGIQYDVSSPLFELFTRQFINKPIISFRQSEPTISAVLVWMEMDDTTQIVTSIFDSTDLTWAGKGMFTPSQQPSLKDSIYYSVRIYGTDRAGNQSNPIEVDSVFFDVRAPSLMISSPLTGEFRNNLSLIFSLNEPLQSWKVSVKSVGGEPDPNSPYLLEMDSSLFDLSEIEKDLADEFQLNDGTIYQLILSGIDRAGNVSRALIVDSVTYDISPPVLTTIYPATGAAINQTTISYSINEPLRAGEFRWEQTEGTMDSSAPHIIVLMEEELSLGDHINILLENQTELTDGASYSLLFVGQDKAGNDGIAPNHINILYDAVPPKFTQVKPRRGSAINQGHVSYTLSENTKEGTFTWKWIGGIKDPISVHTAQLMNDEKNAGVHDSLLLSQSPELVDGGIYSIELNATDRAGNDAETITIENILYDFTPPTITIIYPVSMSFLPHKKWSYSLSETLEEGSFFIRRTGGAEDRNSPYRIVLNNKEKSAGDHDDIQLMLMPDIVEGTIYELSFAGRDRANNTTESFSLPNIQYDFTPPVVSILDLSDSTDVNHQLISFEFSEKLKEAWITWEYTGGVNDPNVIHKQPLIDGELNKGIHSNTQILNSPQLVDGSVYKISIFGFDRAGNKSNVSVVNKIRYDVTAPMVNVTYPITQTYVSSPAISFNLSEKLFYGKIIYTQTEGTFDPLSPQEFIMWREIRADGSYANVFYQDGPELVQGAIYTISIEGSDRAGNIASFASVSGIVYDAIPPVVSVWTADSSLFVNHNRITYSISEDIKSGTIMWKAMGGENDPSSPHIINLIADELKESNLENYTLINAPSLHDGTLYSISIFVKDFAGNTSETAKMDNILFDVTPPILKIVSPGENYITKGSELIFSISEDLLNGKITWQGNNENLMEISTSWDLPDTVLKQGQYILNEYYYPPLVDGGVYSVTITGEDPSGNIAAPSNISNYRIDRTSPVFTSLKPESDSFVNLDHLGYTLSEELLSGSVLIKWDLDQIIVPLKNEELLEGEHPLNPLLAKSEWRNGRKYTIEFSGIDFAGNASDTSKIENLVYDISPPVLAVLHPNNDSYVRSSLVSFSVNEQLLEEELIWLSESGSRVVEKLIDSSLTVGEHSLEHMLSLVEKIPYSVYIQGVDLAGNTGRSPIINNIQYDTTKPELVILLPLENSIINYKEVTYHLNEDLKEGKIIWQNLNGLDKNPIHEIILKNNELMAGDHSDISFNQKPELVENASYMVRLEGTDLAGNKNIAKPVQKFTYDSSPPVFSNISLKSESIINRVNLEFTLSEDILSGKVTFSRVGGALDDKSPHFVNLSGSKLKHGTQGGELPLELIPLINGAVYNIEFYGVDFAKNESGETLIENVAFDNKPPVLYIKTPQNQSSTNQLSIDYSISEDMASGRLLIDIESGSQLIINLDENERKLGEYFQFLPQEIGRLNDGITLNMTLEGSDAAGNMATPYTVENVRYDTTHPKVNITLPLNNDFVNNNSISLEISENLAEGRLIITQTDGILDNRSPLTIPFQTNEMLQGDYNHIQLSMAVPLLNGSIYSYEFIGKDFAGNDVISQPVTHIVYDNEPPVVSLSKPIDSEQIKNTEISYILSDHLSRGVIIFERTGGTTDPHSPHIINLEGSQLRQGSHMDVEMRIVDLLADGGKYSISIRGWDKAGNESLISSVNNILFDVLPPILTIHKPMNGDAIHEPIVTLEMSEKLAAGTLTFKQIGGVIDPGSPYEISLLSPYNSQGIFKDINLSNDVTLMEGAVYSIIFKAQDPAGNISLPVTVSNISYDITPPKIIISDPVENSHLNTFSVSFSIDENLVIGQLEVKRTLGSKDEGSPHSFNLKDNLLMVGTHTMAVHELTELISGSEYMIRLSGMDRAGNEAISTEVGQLIYDVDPPIMEIISPLTGTKVNHSVIGFSINESLQNLKIIWVDENGLEVTRNLPEKYYIPQRFTQVVLNDKPQLVSGSTYSIILEGTDLARNTSETEINQIEFDNTPPQFTLADPLSGDFINRTYIQFESSEPLESGQLIWKAVGGIPDPLSPREVELVNDELIYFMVSSGDLANQMPLQDGTVYQIIIAGRDLAENESQMVLADQVHYDITAPVLQLISPENNTWVNNDDVQFSISENLQSGKITWVRKSGENDPVIHTIDLKSNQWVAGTHSTSGLDNVPLISGVQYQIEITGIDLAGNPSTNTDFKIIYFDTTAPTLVINQPTVGSYINHKNISFSASEPLKSGSLQLIDQKSGVIQEVLLSGEELTILDWPNKPLARSLPIKDGEIYTYQLIGTDLAGNRGMSVKVPDVTYDISKPVFKITRPRENYVNIEGITSYTLNEDLVSGTETWVRTGGKILGPVATANIPQVLELVGEELLAGDHVNIQFANAPELNATTKYKLTLQGIDKAGNESLTVSVDGVEFIPDLRGNWLFKGAIMTVVWTFDPDEGVDDQSTGTFSQGMQMGTKISNQEFGRYSINYSKVPWEMTYTMKKSGHSRFSIFEFRDNSHLKVLTKDRKKPKNWSDGEVMLYKKE